jgi:PAS domain S-box-containing protein
LIKNASTRFARLSNSKIKNGQTPSYGGATMATKEEMQKKIDALEEKCKKEEQARLEIHKMFQVVMDSIPQFIFWKDTESVYLGCNQNFAEAAGVDSPEGIVGKTDYDLAWKKEEADAFRRDDRETMDNDVPKLNIIEPQLQADGKQAWLETNKIPLHNNEGNVIGVLGTFYDITERKQDEEALRSSQQQLMDIIDFLPDATFVTDKESKVIAWNRAMEKMTGIPKEEMLGKGDYAYSVPFYGEKRPIMIDLVSQDNQEMRDKYDSLEEEFQILTGEAFTPGLYGGKGAYVFATAAPLFDSNGNRIGAIESIRDISERKQSENAIREQQEFLNQIINLLPNFVFVKDREGAFILANKALADVYGATPEGLVGKSDADFNSNQEEVEHFLAFDQGVIDSGKEEIIPEEVITGADGKMHWLRTIKRPLVDADGKARRLLGVSVDITDIKQAEEERERLQQEIIEAQRRAIQELSTPVIPIMDRIIVMPMVGSIDSMRARDITRSLLEGIGKHRAKIVILDVTGVSLMDTGIVNHLNKTIQAARLKGAQTIVTGISDAVAESIVDLGIDWSAITALSDLQTGLVIALERLGLKIDRG